jgi:hypothetical protein
LIVRYMRDHERDKLWPIPLAPQLAELADRAAS